jgi:hypothetical protein
MRYDRIMLSSSFFSPFFTAWRAEDMRMHLMGTEPLDAHQLLTTRSSGRRVVRGLWPSDHFGLCLSLTLP